MDQFEDLWGRENGTLYEQNGSIKCYVKASEWSSTFETKIDIFICTVIFPKNNIWYEV